MSVSIVSGDGFSEISISNLEPSTIYIMEVAAVNGAGTGEYSYPVLVETPQSEDMWLLFNICTFVKTTLVLDSDSVSDSSSDAVAIIGGVVAIVFIIATVVIISIAGLVRVKTHQTHQDVTTEDQ